MVLSLSALHAIQYGMCVMWVGFLWDMCSTAIRYWDIFFAYSNKDPESKVFFEYKTKPFLRGNKVFYRIVSCCVVSYDPQKWVQAAAKGISVGFTRTRWHFYTEGVKKKKQYWSPFLLGLFYFSHVCRLLVTDVCWYFWYFLLGVKQRLASIFQQQIHNSSRMWPSDSFAFKISTELIVLE